MGRTTHATRPTQHGPTLGQDGRSARGERREDRVGHPLGEINVE